MKIRIVSDGTNDGTKFTNPDSGERVDKMLYAFRVEGDAAQGNPKATLFCYAPQLDVTCEAAWVKSPPELIQRARDIISQKPTPDVIAAFGELFGIKFRD